MYKYIQLKQMRIIMGVIFVLLVTGLWIAGVPRYLTIEQLKNHCAILLQFTQDHYLISVASFIAIGALAIVFLLPSASLTCLLAGVLFGFPIGIIYATMALTAGAALSFIFVRYILQDAFSRRYKDKFGRLYYGFSSYGYWYLLIVRLVPVIPFFLVNIFAALTQVRLGFFMMATALGVIPHAAFYAFAGQKLRSISGIADIFTLPIIVITIAVLLLAGFAFFLLKRSRRS